MKDYYSENNIHKFIITNNTNGNMTSEDFAKNLFYKIIRDAKDKFILTPGKSIEIECSDDWENLFEKYLIDNFEGTWSHGDAFMCNDIGVKYVEDR